jgi:hypothetical protein
MQAMMVSGSHQPLTYLLLFWALICSAKSSKCSSPDWADMGLEAVVFGFGITAKTLDLNEDWFKPSFIRDRGDGEIAISMTVTKFGSGCVDILGNRGK